MTHGGGSSSAIRFSRSSCCSASEAIDRGGRIRTGEPLPPKGSALPDCATPRVSSKCTYGVAVGAHQLTFLNFGKDAPLVVSANQVREVIGFGLPGKVVPLHSH